jgi:hypothetical protein
LLGFLVLFVAFFFMAVLVLQSPENHLGGDEAAT